jgi:apolipoprotein N-acyltransferase
MSAKQKTAVAVASGLLFFLAFPPFYLGFLAPLSLALLLHLGLSGSRKDAFRYFFISGAVFNIALLYWIPRLMQAGLYIVLALGMVLLIAYLSLWIGLTGLALKVMAERHRILALATFPLVWTAQEKIRSFSEMSFPWVTAGYTYGGYTTLLQFLSVGGVYFYSLLVASTAVLFYLIYSAWRDRKKAAAYVMALIAVYGLLYVFGAVRLRRAPRPEKSLTIGLCQVNVDQNVKWDSPFRDSLFNLNANMTRTCAAQGASLVVWSESAIPCYFLKWPKYRVRVKRLSDSLNVPIIFGSLDYETNPGSARKYDYYNSVFYYRPGAAGFVKYDKIRLVPFSEMLPFEGLFPIISRVDLGEADFSSGKDLTLFDFEGLKAFAPICYEVVYPEFIRAFVERGAGLMVHLTNDGWFGRSGMPFQHANITRFRALECGVPVARCANTGVTCFIDPFALLYFLGVFALWVYKKISHRE